MRTLLALALAVALPGCMSAELARVRRDVGRDFPTGRLAEGHAFAFGRLSLGLARSVVGSDDPTAEAALRHVRGVAVGTYAIDGPVGADRLALPGAGARITRRGWAPVVVARDDSTATYVFARQPAGALRDLLVVSVEGSELTLVRVSGRLDEAVVDALRQGDGVLAPVQTALARAARAPRPSG
ncbi:MAG TPA: hypothetical protein VF576_00995 [Rubricoccaceae bacterium]